MQLLGILSHSDTAERLSLPGLPAERVDVVLPGTLVLAEVMKLFGASSVLVNALGIREGIVIDTLASEGAIAHKADRLRRSANFGARSPLRPPARRAGHAPGALALRPACGATRARCRRSRPAPGSGDAARHRLLRLLRPASQAQLPSDHPRVPAAVHAPRDVHGRVDLPAITPSRCPSAHTSRGRLLIRRTGSRSASLAAILRIADGLDRSHAARVFTRRGRRRRRGHAPHRVQLAGPAC